MATFAELAARNGYAFIRQTDYEKAIAKAVDTGRVLGLKTVRDAYKATERRLYAYPIITQKILDDIEQLEELRENGPRSISKSIVRFQASGSRLTKEEIVDGLILDFEAKIAANEHEIEQLDQALALIREDSYYRAVSGRYFDQLTDAEIAEEIPCDALEGMTPIRSRIARIIDNAFEFMLYLHRVFVFCTGC